MLHSFLTFSALVLAILWLFTHRMHVEGSYFSGIKIQNVYLQFHVSCKEQRSNFLLNSMLYTHEFFKCISLVISTLFLALRIDCCWIVWTAFYQDISATLKPVKNRTLPSRKRVSFNKSTISMFVLFVCSFIYVCCLLFSRTHFKNRDIQFVHKPEICLKYVNSDCKTYCRLKSWFSNCVLGFRNYCVHMCFNDRITNY
jgi:hypothetical protein